MRRFVRQELIPLETTVLERDTQGMTGEDLVPPEAEERIAGGCPGSRPVGAGRARGIWLD